MFFSVIVPVYNVEKYLEACVESVLNQTFGDFELILVDDGSPDNCGRICDEYMSKDSRIKVIHKPNGGLADARKAGIRIAGGEYVYNLDSDDTIEPDTLECAHKIICDTGCDIVSFSYNWVENSVVIDYTTDNAEEGFYNREKIEKVIYPGLLMDKNMNHICYYLAGKAVKTSLLKPNMLAVSNKISLGEDLCCVLPCYLQAESVYISKKAAYQYTKRNDSISKGFNTRQIFQIEDVINEIMMVPYEKPSDFDKQISRYSAFMCFAILASAAEGGHFESADEIKSNILSSVHASEIAKAEFDKLTFKSRIGIYLLKRKHIKTAFYFLYFCKLIKKALGKG